MSSRSRLLAVLVVLGGCRQAVDFDQARLSCALDAGNSIQAPFSAAAPTSGLISKDCATTLGDAVGLDWESFSAEPHAISAPTSLDELVVAGIFTLVSADVGTSNDVLAADWLPGLVENELLDTAPHGEVSRDMNRLWWSLITDRISTIAYEGRRSDSEPYASYRHGLVYVYDPVAASDDPLTAPQVAATLVHEATHHDSGSHIECPGTESYQCDESPDGAFGASTTWTYTWLVASTGRIDDATTEQGWEWVDHECRWILNIENFEPCLESDSR